MAGHITRALEIRLNETLVGYLAHRSTGANIFVFAEEYIAEGPSRPVLSQQFQAPDGSEADTSTLLREVYVTRQKVPQFFSNLLPEGILREHAARELKTSEENEFDLLAAFGSRLPGAVYATAVTPDNFPSELDHDHTGREFTPGDAPLPFSLGGSQLKFSMFRSNGKLSLAAQDDGAEYIVKPPHPLHADVPTNEYLAMLLAQAAGVTIPEVLLLPLNDVDTSAAPHLSFPRTEGYAYAIRRFDRGEDGERIHIEDFAQVIGVYAADEYSGTNYDTMMAILFSLPNGERDLAEFVSRLVVNALLSNGDAHLKNFSLIYPDGRTPELAPAYDIVITQPYIGAIESAALNLARTKRFPDYNHALFRRAAQRAAVDPDIVESAVELTLERAMDLWPGLLKDFEAPTAIREALESHWARLRGPFAAIRTKVAGAA